MTLTSGVKMQHNFFYKVVREEYGRYVSPYVSVVNAASLDNCNQWVVTYYVSKWVEANIGELFVFEKLNEARHSILKMNRENLSIFYCKVQDPKLIDSIPYYPSEFEKFWDNRKNFLPSIPLPGTHICKRVMLISKVGDETDTIVG